MATIAPYIYYKDTVVQRNEACLHVASAAVLYGLSVYTVFPVFPPGQVQGVAGHAAFSLREHYNRLCDSARIIGLNTFAPVWPYERFLEAVKEVVAANNPSERMFARATVHVDALLPGTRSRDLATSLSIFLYTATPILPKKGVRLKTSNWRRVPDYAIPARAKVNGAYINSVLGKQDALDAGYDDCVFLDAQGHVCELSAANIFIVRGGVLATPHTGMDILEGINRRLVLDIAQREGMQISQRSLDLTELYVADEVFVSGTSANIASVAEVDGRIISGGAVGVITAHMQQAFDEIYSGKREEYRERFTGV
jgi:branched-chain amino acid aminotransferase